MNIDLYNSKINDILDVFIIKKEMQFKSLVGEQKERIGQGKLRDIRMIENEMEKVYYSLNVLLELKNQIENLEEIKEEKIK